MTVCIPSLQTKKIPECVLDLEIGTIPDNNTNVNIFIQDITTGARFIEQETSDGAGLVSVDLSAYEFSEAHSYELWITKQSEGIDDKLDITIGTETEKTIALNFSRVFQGEDAFAANAVLEAA